VWLELFSRRIFIFDDETGTWILRYSHLEIWTLTPCPSLVVVSLTRAIAERFYKDSRDFVINNIGFVPTALVRWAVQIIRQALTAVEVVFRYLTEKVI